jgi:hypothetical protein
MGVGVLQQGLFWVTIKESKAGGACSMHFMNKNCAHYFNLKRRDQLGDQGVDGRVVLKCTLK